MKCFDLQVNGAFGVEFSNPSLTQEQFLNTVQLILGTGVTRFLPTLITSELEVYQRNLTLMSQVIKQHDLSYALPGFHLEGPFISPKPGAIGAHNPRWARKPDIKVLRLLNHWANEQIRLITCAAELPNISSLITECRKLNIAVSLGHQLASSEEITDAHADALTHLGNALPNLLDRHHNPIWSGLANDDLMVMIIADGHHLPKELIKCFIRCKTVNNLIAVSDASGAAGLTPGCYKMLGNDAILEPDGKFWNPQRNHLVGSALLLPGCIDFLRRSQLLSDADISQIVWDNPHKLLGMNA